MKSVFEPFNTLKAESRGKSDYDYTQQHIGI